MSDYRRYFVAGGMYFFTLVTCGRRPILTLPEGRRFLRKAILPVQSANPFRLFATVLLPDHWHLVMGLPPGDSDYSGRIRLIKERFTLDWLSHGLPEAPISNARKNKGERGIWQPRFWEHSIHDENDLEDCVDYLHWNPRKHNLVDRIRDYPWSSFHRFVKAGQYDLNWGGTAPRAASIKDQWGEP